MEQIMNEWSELKNMISAMHASIAFFSDKAGVDHDNFIAVHQVVNKPSEVMSNVDGFEEFKTACQSFMCGFAIYGFAKMLPVVAVDVF